MSIVNSRGDAELYGKSNVNNQDAVDLLGGGGDLYCSSIMSRGFVTLGVLSSESVIYYSQSIKTKPETKAR